MAALVRERRWHRSQDFSKSPDGRREMTLAVGVSPEFERWRLGWGEGVEVCATPALRRRLTEVAAHAAHRHAG